MGVSTHTYHINGTNQSEVIKIQIFSPLHVNCEEVRMEDIHEHNLINTLINISSFWYCKHSALKTRSLSVLSIVNLKLVFLAKSILKFVNCY